MLSKWQRQAQPLNVSTSKIRLYVKNTNGSGHAAGIEFEATAAETGFKRHTIWTDDPNDLGTYTDAEIVVNVQGDEPFIDKKSLEKALEILRNDTENSIDLVSLMKEITEDTTIQNPNNVKVVVDNQNVALYFSRSPIPFNRDKISGVTYYQHIGVYVFRKNALIDFSTWQPTALEQAEKLEQLRYLENGKRIKMVLTKHVGVGIDTPEDLEKAQKMWEDKE